MKLGTIIATNEALQNELPEQEDELQAAETATEVAETAGEVSAEETEIEQTDNAIADAEGAEDKIEELTEIAEGSLAAEGETVEEGEVGEEGEGLSENEAAVVQITHEALMRSIGMPVEKIRYTSESFASKSNRRQATLEALDGLKESAKKIADNLIAALKAAWNTVSNFLMGLLRNRALMEKHLVNLKAKVAALPADAKAKTDKVSAGGKMGGTASSAMEILDEGAKLITTCATVAEAVNKGSEGAAQAAQALNGAKVSGGRVVKVEGTEDGGVKIELTGSSDAKEGATLSKQEMVSLVDKAIATIQALRGFEKTQNRLSGAMKAIIARVSEAYSQVRSKVGGAESKLFHGLTAELKKDARVARAVVSKVGGAIPGAVFAGIKGAADYVTASLNAHGAKAAEKAPEAK